MRSLIAGICKNKIATPISAKRPAPMKTRFLFDMRESVPDEYEMGLIGATTFPCTRFAHGHRTNLDSHKYYLDGRCPTRNPFEAACSSTSLSNVPHELCCGSVPIR